MPENDPANAQPRSVRLSKIQFDYAGCAMEHLTLCNLCGHQSFTEVARSDRYAFPARTVVCNACGLTFLNPRMTADEYRSFYNGTYRPLVSAYHGRTINSSTIQCEQKQYAAEVIAFVQDSCENRRGGHFLDIGGSTGVVATAFVSHFDFTATIVDPSVAELEHAQANGIKVIPCLFEEWDRPSTRFDVIGMFQTADHLLDLAGTLAKIRNTLSEDGLFIVDIVDFDAVRQRHGNLEMAIKIDHPYSLTDDSFSNALAAAGFDVQSAAFESDNLHRLYVCAPGQQRLVRQDFGRVCNYIEEIRTHRAAKETNSD